MSGATKNSQNPLTNGRFWCIFVEFNYVLDETVGVSIYSRKQNKMKR